MTSWDALEAYLLDLVRKVGGVSYVLRDSGGQHLAPRLPPLIEAPRPPPLIDRKAVVEAALFRRFLKDVENGDKPDKPDEPDKGHREAMMRILEAVEQRHAMEEASQGISRERGIVPLPAALMDRERALARYNARIERFKPHSTVLDEAVGVDFVRKGPGKRYVHREATLPFIAERYLSSYLLIIAFRDVGAVDAQGVVLALERARSVISDMLGDLPPDDGGDRAIAHSQRPA